MKKRFLPFSLLLVIMILGQSVMADQGGHYVPRAKETATAESVMSSMRVNQHTGMIDPAWMIKASQQVSALSTKDEGELYWLSIGPSNMGGRTTSVLYNRQNSHEICIGSMGGGVFYSWNKGVTWHQIGGNMMVSCLTQAEDGTIYVGTGDGMNAASYNALGDMSYENGFIGSGLYMIDVNNHYTMSPVPSTQNAVQNEVNAWSFINDIAVDGNTVIVATDFGLKYLAADKMSDPNAEWKFAKTKDGADIMDQVQAVKVLSNHKIVASVGDNLVIGTLEALEYRCDANAHLIAPNTYDTLPYAGVFYDIAVAPSDANVIYAASINNKGNHNSVYLSENQGQTWRVIVPVVNSTIGHQIYEDRGLFNHGLFVNPSNAYSLYVTGYNLWRLDKSDTDPNGYYLVTKQSNGNTGSIFSNTYLHSGVNAMAFNPDDEKSAFVATDGGIFKAQGNATLYPTFANCNRGYVSTRCFNVAPSSDLTRLMAGAMDHGPILLDGEAVGHLCQAVPLYPNNSYEVYGNFSDSDHGGPCAVSTINPDVFFIVTRDGAIQRTESSGVDYDATNFTANQSFTYTGYRMPIALWECYDYENSVDSVWFRCKANQLAGDVVKCYSHNGNYPFDIVLPYDMHYNAEFPAESDSLLVKDPIASKFYVADETGVYYTMDALRFNKATDWYKLVTLNASTGAASCVTASADGDVVFVGTKTGKVYRITNLLAAYDANTSTPSSEDFAPVVTPITLPEEMTGRYITSIAISRDNKKVVLTFGNYGNEDYVLYTDDALAEEPTFVSKQGELPKMPVYSCLFDSRKTDDLLIGTEHGVFRTQNIGSSNVSWVNESAHMGDVPVMDLKQQNFYAPDQLVPMYVDTVVVMVTYPGINNEGVIYAATYGRGLFRCDHYRIAADVPEAPAVAAKQLSMYPNPVSDAAKVSFELSQNATVSYQIFDMAGRMVMNRTLGSFAEGNHEINVNMDGLSTGTYLLRLNAGEKSSSVKFMVY